MFVKPYMPYLEKLKVVEKHQRSAPVLLEPIAEELGTPVHYISNFPDNISGQISKNKKYNSKSGFNIFVNANHNFKRRRFTIAHELAHFILHEDKIGDGIVDDALYRSGLTDHIERQANALAADILMPKHLLKPLRKEYQDDAKQLAELFKVSEMAMKIQLGQSIYD